MANGDQQDPDEHGKVDVKAFADMSQSCRNPANVINEDLLEKFPDAQFVTMHDNQWCALIEEADRTFPDDEELLHRVNKRYMPRVISGGIFLVSVAVSKNEQLDPNPALSPSLVPSPTHTVTTPTNHSHYVDTNTNTPLSERHGCEKQYLSEPQEVGVKMDKHQNTVQWDLILSMGPSQCYLPRGKGGQRVGRSAFQPLSSPELFWHTVKHLTVGFSPLRDISKYVWTDIAKNQFSTGVGMGCGNSFACACHCKDHTKSVQNIKTGTGCYPVLSKDAGSKVEDERGEVNAFGKYREMLTADYTEA